MTLFEYIAVAVSSVLSFGAVRLLDGLPQTLDRSRRFWPQALLVVDLLWVHVHFWWIFWSYHAVAACFVLSLAISGLLIRGLPVAHRVRLIQAVLIGIFLAGALSDSPVLHRMIGPAIIVALVLVTTALGLGLL